MVAPGAQRLSSTLDDGPASSDVIGNTTVAATGADCTVGVSTISMGTAVTVGVEAESEHDSPSAGIGNDSG